MVFQKISPKKEENEPLANKKLKQVMTEIGVDVKFERVQRLGKFDKEGPTPRNVIVTLSNNWDVRTVLAKSALNRKRMRQTGIHILPALSAENAKRKYVSEKTARASEQRITPSQLKIRNFEFSQHGVLVPLSEEQPEQY